MVSHGLVTMWRLTKIQKFDLVPRYRYPGTMLPSYSYTHSLSSVTWHLGPVPIPVPMVPIHDGPVPVPIPISMVSYPYPYPYPWLCHMSYPYPYPYPWSRTRTRTHTHGLEPVPVPIPMASYPYPYPYPWSVPTLQVCQVHCRLQWFARGARFPAV